MNTRCGFIAIVGRPNAGKSTLLNHLVGQKVSITSRKPQTTRQQILGVKTDADTQMVFVDTPGIDEWSDISPIQKHMHRTVQVATQGVDLVLMLVDRTRWDASDEKRLQILKKHAPVVLCINKVDLLDKKTDLLAHIDQLKGLDFADIVPISALKGDNQDSLLKLIEQFCPSGPFQFDKDDLTDKNLRFLAAEFIREKIIRQLGQELPYATAVEIESFETSETCHTISAVIYVERSGQKPIVIGKKGERLRKIGQEARLEMEKLFEHKVMLKLWVKVKKDWSQDEGMLRSFGIASD